MKRAILFFILFGSIYINITAQTVSDYDGNVYTTVTIGNQQWLVENLKVTHFRNGDPIPLVTDSAAWTQLNTGAYCWYNNNIENKATYGALYNWFTTIDERKIAPQGWHVPTEAEWVELIEYLGGYEIAGGKMKESGTTHWFPPNTGATNSSGFTGLPGGVRLVQGFGGMEIVGDWWSCTYDAGEIAHARSLYYKDTLAYDAKGPCIYGYSIRCLKDAGIGIYDLNDQKDVIIYPNPSYGIIRIEYPFFLSITNVSIYDLSGKIIIRRNISKGNNEINIESLPKGIYFLRITDSVRILQKKIIKM
jgi:uncharacterized protein (TIGR02145 family)